MGGMRIPRAGVLALEERLREWGLLSPEESCFQLAITYWGPRGGLSPDLHRQSD